MESPLVGVVGGALPTGAAEMEEAAAEAPAPLNSSTSFLMIRPFGPDPLI